MFEILPSLTLCPFGILKFENQIEIEPSKRKEKKLKAGVKDDSPHANIHASSKLLALPTKKRKTFGVYKVE